MLECLPHIFPSPFFALKGGTAINFFVRNMPRLSVDIDLTYLPLNNRQSALEDIRKELENISSKINQNIQGAKAFVKKTNQGITQKVMVCRNGLNVKIEPNFILRETIHPIQNRDICDQVRDQFEFFYEAPILSFEDLYGGKICAALDRQHSRDLFDIKCLFENEGLTNRLRQSFIVYLLSNPRPIHEVLQPNEIDISETFNKEFLGMTRETIPIEELVTARSHLIKSINSTMTEQEKKFLVTFQNVEPDWPLFSIDIKNLPGIKWKLVNLKKLKSQNPSKHSFLSEQLMKKLGL